MNPADLVDERLLDICRDKQSIVIVGYTKTGKIKIATELSKRLNTPLIISDHHINNNRETALENMMDDVLYYHNDPNKSIIVEGVLCFRLLRKGIQLNNFYPDMVIKVECNDETIKHFYRVDGEEHKIKRAMAFNKGLAGIWEEYLDILSINQSIKRPAFIKVNTSIF